MRLIPHGTKRRILIKDPATRITERARNIRANIEPILVARHLGVDEGTKIPCPWHADDDPSLQFYRDGMHCYGACNRGYSVIDLAMELKALSFTEALEWLESNYGLDPMAPATLNEDRQADIVWAAAEVQIINVVRPYLLESSNPVYKRVREHVWLAYAYWDKVVKRTRARGESPTKVLGVAATKIRKYLEEHTKE